MDKYFHTSTQRNSYSIKKIGGNNRPVALIIEGEFQFMVSSGENVEEVRAYCIRKGIWFPYRHENFGDNCYIYEEVSRRTVAVVDKQRVFHFLENTRESEIDVKAYCIKNNLCKWKPLTHVMFNMRDVIMTNEEDNDKETVAIIDNINGEKFFSFFEWTGVDEVDVRLYCRNNNLYSE